MVKLSDDVKKTFLKLIRITGMADSSEFEERVEADRSFDEEDKEEVMNLGLTPTELEDAVKAFRKTASEITNEIKRKKEQYKNKRRKAKKATGIDVKDYKLDAQDLYNEIQVLKKEYDEVAGKFQVLKQSLNEYNRQRRQEKRREEHPVDFLEFDIYEFQNQQEELEEQRQREKHSVQAMHEALDRQMGSIGPDFTDVEEDIGEEEAGEILDEITDDWEDSGNEWLDEDDTDDGELEI